MEAGIVIKNSNGRHNRGGAQSGVVKSGSDDYALITVLAGIAAVLIMLLPYLSQLLDAVNGMLGG